MATTMKITSVEWTATGIPAGLQIGGLTGVVSGTPSAEGTSNMGISVQTNYGTDTSVLRVVAQAPSTAPDIADNQVLYVEESVVMAPYMVRSVNAVPNVGSPVITSADYVEANIGQVFTYQITTTFVDSERQIYSVSDAPQGSTFNSSTGLLTWEVPAGAITANNNSTELTFTAGVENSAGTASKTVTVLLVKSRESLPQITADQQVVIEESELMSPYRVTGTAVTQNRGTPKLADITAVNAPVRSTTTFQAQVSYADAETEYSISNVSDNTLGVTVSDTGLVSITVPRTATIGNTATFTLGVSNGSGSDSKTITVTFTEPDFYRPVLYGNGYDTATATIGSTFTYQVSVHSADPDGMTYAMSGGTLDGASFDTSTGLLTWNVPSDPVTAEALRSTPTVLTFTATNSYGNSDTMTLSITTEIPASYLPSIEDNQVFTVEESEPASVMIVRSHSASVNPDNPVITSAPYVEANIGQTFTYQITTSFVDSERQVYSVTNAPQGSSFDSSTGVLTWDVPVSYISTNNSNTVTFTAGVENSTGTASQAVTVLLVVPRSALPSITAGQTVTVEESEAMTPYQVAGTNTAVNAGNND